MKGITSVIAIILLLLITISIIGFTAAFFQTVVVQSGTQAEQATQSQIFTQGQLIGPVASGSGTITIKNVGSSPVTQVTTLMNGTPVTATLASPIAPGRVGTLVFNQIELASLPVGKIKIVAAGNEIDADNPVVLSNYWQFDDATLSTVVKDSVGGSDGTFSGESWNDGTLRPACPDCPAQVDGKYGNAMKFDGINDYVNILNSSSLNPTNTVTVSAWVYIDTSSASLDNHVAYILSRTNIRGADGYAVFWDDRASLSRVNQIRFAVIGNSSVIEVTGGDNSITSTGWYHLVGTYDDFTASIYINGVLKGTENRSTQFEAINSVIELNSLADALKYFDITAATEGGAAILYQGTEVRGKGGSGWGISHLLQLGKNATILPKRWSGTVSAQGVGGSNWGTTVHLQTSTDGTSWTTQSQTTGSTNGNWQDLSYTGSSITTPLYVRFKLDDGSGTGGSGNYLKLRNVAVTSLPVSGAITMTNYIYPLTIGYNSNAGMETYFTGSIDEVQIWNRALNAAEINQSMNNVMVRHGIVGAWRFEEGTGTTAYDSHIYDYTGRYEKALTFDGINDYVVNSDYAWQNTTSFTVSGWFKTSNSNSTSGTIFDKFASGFSPGAFTMFTGSDNVTGGTITYSGGYTIHTFTSSGTFTANRNLNAEVLVVGGGGGGSYSSGRSGGGGAGGYRYNPSFGITAQAYTVTVGAGGVGAVPNSVNNENGTASIFSTITATGGGRGGGTAGSMGGNVNGAAGGSGGGGEAHTPGLGGAGNTPSTSPSQGNNGGNGVTKAFGGGGGGGASSAGANGNGNAGGAGGNGTSNSISGSSVCYAGGGGGGGATSGGSATCGGGAGASGGNGASGTANTGGGGGAAGTNNGGSGGSGIVIIKYPTERTLHGAGYTGGCVNPTNRFDITGNTIINDNAWHHGAMVYNGMQIMLYVDGILDASAPVPTTGNVCNADTGFTIGATRRDNPTSFFNGVIDEVKIINRAIG